MNKLLYPLRYLQSKIRGIKKFIALRQSENYVFLKFAPPGHFYSPIPDLAEIKRDRKIIFDQSSQDLRGIRINKVGQLALGQDFASVYHELNFPDKKEKTHRFYFDNNYFSYGDAIALYGFLRVFKPQKIIEVGSGFSSAMILDVRDKFSLQDEMRLTFIEPFPQRLMSLLMENDQQTCQIIPRRVQDIPLDLFGDLDANDILFIDSSHTAKTNSDVLHMLFVVLPSLKPGVLIHFHDVLWPFEYPLSWLNEGRAWNEAYFVRAFLQDNEAYEIVFFNDYLATHHSSFLNKNLPLMLKKPTALTTPGNTSLWIRKMKPSHSEK
jgi:hypothetical protein